MGEHQFRIHEKVMISQGDEKETIVEVEDGTRTTGSRPLDKE
jgi:hypothetical protein